MFQFSSVLHCGDFPGSPIGRYLSSSHFYINDTVTAICKAGYYYTTNQSEPNSATCLYPGTWSNDVGNCTGMFLKILNLISNNRNNLKISVFRSRVLMDCKFIILNICILNCSWILNSILNLEIVLVNSRHTFANEYHQKQSISISF